MPRGFRTPAMIAFCILWPQTALAQAECAGCHPKETAAYRRTSMSRSFYRPAEANRIENYGNSAYYHEPSGTWFGMVERDGRLFQRQYQIGFDGRQTNVLEKQVDYVVGSGNHSRTYLSRTASNNLIELPLAWYAEKGGYWAMNPGYDSPDHDGLRRRIGVDCMFCHNAYPGIAPGSGKRGADPVFAANLPEGIDCRRCHGPGDSHVHLAQSRAAPAAIRAAIVNPARLTPQRRMEVCMQCHLETTSFPLPGSIVRYERAPFSYRAGEPLSDYKLFFDRTPPDDSFLIASSAYRLRKSQCFLRSGGRMTCLTCHDPHAESARDYNAVCRGCHAEKIDREIAAREHPAAATCADCHMPKRRTEDVVHVVMTDHFIQRTPPSRDLLAPLAENRHDGPNQYRGEVRLYYPGQLPRPEDELYAAAAQVIQGSDVTAGIPRLTAAVTRLHPAAPESYADLADALRTSNECSKAAPLYEEAIRIDPSFVSAMRREALCGDSIPILQRALNVAPEDAKTWTQIGVAYLRANRTAEGVSALQKATALDPELPEAWNDLGGALLNSAPSGAEPALRNALRYEPNYAEAHNNLGSLLSNAGRFDEARYEFEAALRYRPNYDFARFNYAIALMRVNRLDQAQEQIETSLRNRPGNAEAHEMLGVVLESRGAPDRALAEYREALRIQPGLARANLGIGRELAGSGDAAAALPYLQRAAQAADQVIREQALALLRKYGAK